MADSESAKDRMEAVLLAAKAGRTAPVTDQTDDPGRGKPDARLFIASLEKGLKVLEAFPDMTSELGFQEIAVATGFGKSAVQRFIYTLHHLGYLRRDPATRKYRLSSKVFLRGYALALASKVVQESHDELVRISRECDDTCVLGVLEDSEMVILSSVQGRRIDSLNLAVGMRFPAYKTSSGLAILAFLPLERARMALQGHPDPDGTDMAASRVEELIESFPAIRAQGYCRRDGSFVAGYISVSAPIFDAAGNPVAALNVSTLRERNAEPGSTDELISTIVEAAGTISTRLGYAGGRPGGQAGLAPRRPAAARRLLR